VVAHHLALVVDALFRLLVVDGSNVGMVVALALKPVLVVFSQRTLKIRPPKRSPTCSVVPSVRGIRQPVRAGIEIRYFFPLFLVAGGFEGRLKGL
jgi:hypothetical protein